MAAAPELVSVPAGIVPAFTAFSALALPGSLLVLLWMINTSIVLLRAPHPSPAPVPAV